MQISTQTLRISRINTWASLAVIIAAVAALVIIGRAGLAFGLVAQPEIDIRLTYQLVTLVMTLIVLVVLRALNPANFSMFARLGNIAAQPDSVRWLGIKASDTWRGVGLNFAVVVTLATAAFIYFGVMGGQPPRAEALAFLPWVIVLSAVNAFVEEALTRFGVVVSLYGSLPNNTIFIIAALVFGIPHFFGVPGGIIGSLMAGFLGWLLAKSVLETKGVFWAWFVHFLQDVVIFFGLFAMIAAA